MVDCAATSECRDVEIEQWQFLGIYCGGEHLEIAPGIDVWDHPWDKVPADHPTPDNGLRPEQKPAQKKVWVRETISGETHHCPVWDITVFERRWFWQRARPRRVRFAASTLSIGIWGFFRPQADTRPDPADAG